MNKVYVLGVGPGSPDYVLPIVTKLVSESDIIIGGQRNLDIFQLADKKTMIIKNNLAEIVDEIKAKRDLYTISVLVSGDPGFYSMLNFLLQHFDKEDLEVIAGISSTQYLISRMKTCWQDAVLTSLHGRMDDDLINIVGNNRKVVLLTDYQFSADKIASYLLDKGISGKRITVGENLSYPDERIVEGSLKDISQINNFKMSVMVIEDE
ncbi:MAG: precorrin-6y C5,15-methyltransferase (decarboxylating) subunit CbiE [Clostridia bacterium]